MAFSTGATPGIVFYAPLITLLIIGESSARELRPSYHGLGYQNSAESKKSPAMLSFFGASSSPSTSTPGGMSLPKAMNSNNASWLQPDTAGGGGGEDRVKRILLITSLVCGIAGAILLVASTLLFLLKFRKKRSSSSLNNINDDNDAK